MPDFASFNEFVDQTDSAKFEHHRETISHAMRKRLSKQALVATAVSDGADDVAISDDMIKVEFEKMKAYVLGMYKDITDVKIQHTFLGLGGKFHDCIPYEQLPTYRAAKKAGYRLPSDPPAPSPSAAPENPNPAAFGPYVNSILPPLRRELVDPFGHPLQCPEDRVPLRRVTIAQMARFGKFENFFRKQPAAAPFAGEIGSSEIHHHAVCNASNGGDYYGCSTYLNVWQVDPKPGVFSLSQLWLVGTNTASGKIQTIESGWQTYPDQWATTAPVLFVYYNPNGYDATGGYLTAANYLGFVPSPGSGWIIGDALPPPYSAANADQRGLLMQWQIDNQGAWWLYLGGDSQSLTPVGYFPAGLYNSGTIAKSAQTLQFGGEVCSQSPNDPSYPQTGPMGSGKAPFTNPSDSFKEVAFQKQIAVQTSLGSSLVPANLQVQFQPEDAGYSATQVNSGTANWGSYMFFGGSQSLWNGE